MSFSGNLGTQSLFSDTIGGMPEDQQTISPARARAKWNHNLRGIEIVQLGATYPGMEVHCIQTYLDIYKAGHTYIRSPDNDRWIDTTQKKHRHFEDTDEDGGAYHNIEIANAAEWVRMDYVPMRASQWYANTLGGAGVDSEGSLVLKTNAIAGNYYQITNGGKQISFEAEQKLLMHYELVTANSRRISWRGGVNCEEVWQTSLIRRMYGLEWCDDTGADKNYMLFSADGSERNALISSLSANNQSNVVRGLQLHFIPATVIKMIYEGANTLITKGSAVPRTLSTGSVETLRFGIKANESQDKQYRLRAVRLVGKASLTTQPW